MAIQSREDRIKDEHQFRAIEVGLAAAFFAGALKNVRELVPPDTASSMCPYCFRSYPHAEKAHRQDALLLAKTLSSMPKELEDFVLGLIADLSAHDGHAESGGR